MKITIHDGEFWVTAHPRGREEKGTPLLIEGSAGHYVVKGGAGGKLNGTSINPKSMSKPRAGTEGGESKTEGTQAPATTTAPSNAPTAAPATTTAATAPAAAPTETKTEPTTTPAPTPPVNPMRARYEEKRAKFEAAANHANTLSAGATTLEQHQAAMAAHAEAYTNYKPWSISSKKELNHHATEYHKHKKEIKRLEKEAKKGQPRVKKEAVKGTSFKTSSVEQVKEHFTKEWGMGFANGVKSGAAQEYAKEHIWGKNDYNEEQRKSHNENYMKLRAHEQSDPSYGLRGHTPIDINGKSASANAMREMLTHVDNSLKQLEASGFNPKTALKKADVSFVSGTTGRANGHAWGGNMMGEGTSGYFSVSPFKRGSFNEEQAAMHKARMDAGKPRWSVSSSEADQTRGTIVHEMAHALGLREGVNSPKKLTEAFKQAFPTMNYSEQKKWITENISEYATKNIKEFDAELSAMVTAPDYKWGTLPKQLEDHVKWLWDYKEK